MTGPRNITLDDWMVVCTGAGGPFRLAGVDRATGEPHLSSPVGVVLGERVIALDRTFYTLGPEGRDHGAWMLAARELGDGMLLLSTDDAEKVLARVREMPAEA